MSANKLLLHVVVVVSIDRTTGLIKLKVYLEFNLLLKVKHRKIFVFVHCVIWTGLSLIVFVSY